MTDLVTFLRARLDEDAAETQADEVLAHEQATGWLPERVLREVETKRRIVALHQPRKSGFVRGTPGESTEDMRHRLVNARQVCPVCLGPDGRAEAPCPTLRLLALPYVDHPDYDEAWRP